jgi:hypothetical protein
MYKSTLWANNQTLTRPYQHGSAAHERVGTDGANDTLRFALRHHGERPDECTQVQ